MVIRKLNELSENYQKLQGNYAELIANYNNMKKKIVIINKSQEEMKNTISFLMYFIDYALTVVPFFFSPLFPFALHLPSDPHPLPLIS